MINHDSSTPKYIQLSDILEKKITEGKYTGGEKFPSENDLCKNYNVSRITVRQALNILEQKNLIYTVHGKGTFVKALEIRQSFPKIISFSETLSHKGLNGYTKIHSFDIESENKEAKDILNFTKYGSICNLNLIGFAQNMPIVYYNSYIRKDIGEKMFQVSLELEESKVPFSTFDIYSRLEIEFGRVEQKITAINIGEDLAEILHLMPGSAVIVLESLYYSKDEMPIEYKVGYYRSDVYAFNLKREL